MTPQRRHAHRLRALGVGALGWVVACGPVPSTTPLSPEVGTGSFHEEAERHVNKVYQVPTRASARRRREHGVRAETAKVEARRDVPKASPEEAVVTSGQAKFTLRPLTVGDAVTLTDDSEMRVSMTMSGPDMNLDSDYSMAEHKKMRLTTLEVDDGKITRLKVKYLEHENHEERAGNRQEDPSPIEGKTYAAGLRNGVLEVEDEYGGEVNDQERKEIVDDVEWLEYEKQDDTAFIPDRVLDIGEVFKPDTAVTKAMFGKVAENVKSLELRLTKIATVRKQRCGIFEVRVEIDLPFAAGTKMRALLEGRYAVALSTRRGVEYTLSGPLSTSIDRGPMTVTGEGQLTAKLFAEHTLVGAPEGQQPPLDGNDEQQQQQQQ